MEELTSDYLKTIFYYKDGRLYYIDKKRNNRKAISSHAGTINKYGYRVLNFFGKKLMEHRLIWIMFYGQIPPKIEIDHIDGDPLNNRIENLRLATRSQNCCNRRANKNSKSGFKGVYLNKSNGTNTIQSPPIGLPWVGSLLNSLLI